MQLKKYIRIGNFGRFRGYLYMIPVNFHTATSSTRFLYIEVLLLFTWHRYEISSQYESYRNEFIAAAVLEWHNLVPVRLSYRYEFNPVLIVALFLFTWHRYEISYQDESSR